MKFARKQQPRSVIRGHHQWGLILFVAIALSAAFLFLWFPNVNNAFDSMATDDQGRDDGYLVYASSSDAATNIGNNHNSKNTTNVQFDSHVYDVLIIGSGWSGLGAADTLRKAGLDNFEILEARNAVGGRSRTVYPFTNDLAVELGSAWTYEDTLVHKILEDNHIPFGEIHYDLEETFGLYQSGHFEGESVKVSGEIVGKERKQLIDKLWWHGMVHYSEKKTDAILDSRNDVPYINILRDYIEHRGFASNSKARQFLQSMIHSQIQLEYGSPLDEISTSYVGHKLDDCFFCSAIYYIPVKGGGFDKVLAPVSDPLKDKIRLNQIVTKIEYHKDQPARVSYTDATDGSKHAKLAKKVLVTVSLGVLKAKSIQFVPSLPNWKQDAIDYMGFGVVNKCIFYWENREQAATWWPKGKEYMTLVTEQDSTAGLWTSFFNDKDIGNGGEFVLSAWIGGDKARAIEELADDVIVEQVLDNLRAMFGDSVPEPSKYVISRWGKDEFARGSYSFVKIGGEDPTSDARKKLSRTVGKRLFWAGEATTSEYGTTYGAYGSGITAARRILRRS